MYGIEYRLLRTQINCEAPKYLQGYLDKEAER